MATSEGVSIEYTTIVKCTDKITSEISADPLSVATKLVSIGMIPQSLVGSAQLQTKEKKVKASELVEQITNRIGSFPESFEEFLGILNEFTWLKKLVECVGKEYDALKLKVLYDS